ncbi:MAG: hypothetical protein JWQ03_821 [Variovorax sp.]|nr:hypothetical protein [Variovorax sp.]
MNFQKIWVPLAGIALLAAGYMNNGWAGVALVGGGILMFLLLHFTRTMKVLKRATDRPIGHVASAVMLNAKLKPGMTLLHVVAMTRALGELRSLPDTQPELYRWTDGGGSFVDAEFAGGKLRKWGLVRPQAEPEAVSDASTAGPPTQAGP